MGSSAVYVSQKGGGSSSTSLEDSNEQETEENRTTFTLETPAAPLPTQQKNATVPRFKPRRPRPTKFTKVTSTTTSTPYPSTSTLTTIKVSKPSEGDSQEENSGKEISSLESDSNSNSGGFLANPKPQQKKPITTDRLSSEVQEDVRDLSHNEEGSRTPVTPPPTPHTSSTRSPVRNPPIRQNPAVRHRITSKVIPTTPAATMRRSTVPTIKEEEPLPQTTPRTPSTIVPSSSIRTNNPESVPPPQRPPTSKTIDAIDIDDSKIPVISGIGSAVSSPNLHTGSIMSVKQPLPIQTHNQNVNVLPKSLETVHHGLRHIPPSSQHHHNLIFADKSEILVQEIVRSGDSIMLHWESSKQTSGGFRIIYRLFGEDTFRHGPPLAATETEYRIKNVPNNVSQIL